MALTKELEHKRGEKVSEDITPLEFFKIIGICAPFMVFGFWALPSMSHDTHGWQWWVLLLVTIFATGGIAGGFLEIISKWTRNRFRTEIGLAARISDVIGKAVAWLLVGSFLIWLSVDIVGTYYDEVAGKFDEIVGSKDVNVTNILLVVIIVILLSRDR